MDNKSFPFERLPAELREAIYETLLTTSTKIKIRLILTKSMEKAQITGCDTLTQLSPSILLTKRQIYYEALPVLYRRNTFSFTSLTSFRQFTRDAKPGLTLLRHVEIATTGRFALWEAMNQLLRAEGLRSLRIWVGAEDVKERGWSDLVLEVADYVRRGGLELEGIGFVSEGRWEASGSEFWRSCSSEGAPEQVRKRVERRLALIGALDGEGKGGK